MPTPKQPELKNSNDEQYERVMGLHETAVKDYMRLINVMVYINKLQKSLDSKNDFLVIKERLICNFPERVIMLIKSTNQHTKDNEKFKAALNILRNDARDATLVKIITRSSSKKGGLNEEPAMQEQIEKELLIALEEYFSDFQRDIRRQAQSLLPLIDAVKTTSQLLSKHKSVPTEEYYSFNWNFKNINEPADEFNTSIKTCYNSRLNKD